MNKNNNFYNNNKIELLDVVEIIEAICMYYPNNFKIRDLEQTAKAWHLPLQESDRSTVMSNLLAHIKTNHFPPTIADLLNAEQEKDKPDKYEHQRRAIPNPEETLLMLENYEKQSENRATPEERTKALAKIVELNPWIKRGHKNK